MCRSGIVAVFGDSVAGPVRRGPILDVRRLRHGLDRRPVPSRQQNALAIPDPMDDSWFATIRQRGWVRLIESLGESLGVHVPSAVFLLGSPGRLPSRGVGSGPRRSLPLDRYGGGWTAGSAILRCLCGGGRDTLLDGVWCRMPMAPKRQSSHCCRSSSGVPVKSAIFVGANRGPAGPWRVMAGHGGSWRVMAGHAGPPWVMVLQLQPDDQSRSPGGR